jgi:3-hydroxyacyl-CoA dehydrogenase/enoyl-CoA hydratase/3-hydroxybutyryl-CoA epimerase
MSTAAKPRRRMSTPDANGIVELALRAHGTILGADLAELEEAIYALEDSGAARAGVVVVSGGWDLRALLAIRTAADGELLARGLQRACRAIAHAAKPVVAVVLDEARGPAFELALACDARVGAHGARLGFDDLALGLVPCGGGLDRLGAMVGLGEALAWLLDGRVRDARDALAVGVIDDVAVAVRALDAARRRADALAKRPRARRTPALGVGVRELLTLRNPIGRRRTLGRARDAIFARTRGHDPAPFVALDVVSALAARGAAAADDVAARAFGELVVTESTRERIGAARDRAAVLRAAPRAERAPSRVGVAGDARTSVHVAAALANADVDVVLHDPDAAALAEAFTHATPPARVIGASRLADLAVCDVVLVAEGGLDLPEGPPRLGIVPWADADEGLVLLPDASAPAVIEVASSEGPASVASIEAATAIARAFGVVAIPTRGFAWRLRVAFLREIFLLCDEGVAPAAVDRALVDWGWASGALSTIEAIGPSIVQRLVGRATLGTRGDARVAAEEIQMRVALAVVVEALRALDDGALREARDGDVLAVLGLGFPAFRGGPFRYVDALGAEEITRRLAAYRARFGERFVEPACLVRSRETRAPIRV